MRRLGFAVVGLLIVACFSLGRQPQAKTEQPAAPKLDAHGDALPPAALARIGTLRFRHRNQNLATMTPDGKGLVLYGREGLQHMDLDTGKLTQWSDYKAVGSYSMSRRSRGPITSMVFPGGDELYFAAIRFRSPLSTSFAIATGHTVLLRDPFEDFDYSVFDGATGIRMHRLRSADYADSGSLVFLSLTSDGKGVLAQSTQPRADDTVGPPGVVRCFDLATKQLRYEIGVSKDGELRTLTISDDGQQLLLVALTGGKGELQSWDIAKGKQLGKFTIDPRQATRLQLVKDSKHLFALNEDSSVLRQLDARTGAEIQTFAMNRGEIQSFLAAPDGKHLYVVTANGIQQWDVPNKKLLRTLVPGYGDSRIALSPSGDKLYFVADTAVIIWDTSTGKELRPAGGHLATIWSVAFAPDGKKLLTSSADGTVRLWDCRTQEQLREFASRGPANGGLYGGEPFNQLPYVQAGFSSDGQRVVTAWPGLPVIVWDAATGARRMQLGEEPKDGDFALACSPRDNLVATVGSDGRIRIWDVLNGEQRLDFQWLPNDNGNRQLEIAAAGFAPSGATLTIAGLNPPGNLLKLFETSTGKERLTVDLAGKLQRDLGEVPALVLAERLVLKVAYAGDGKTLALGGVHTIRLHHPATGKETLTLGGLKTFGPSVSLSPDGTLAATGTLDGYVQLWDTRSGKLVSEVKGHNYFVAATAFSPDGKTLASASNDATVLLWDVAQLLQQPVRARVLTPAALEQLWSDLASADAAKAFAVMGELSESAAEVPAYFKGRLKAVPLPDPKQIDGLVAALNSEQYSARQKATAELAKLSDLAVPALRAQLANKPSLEMCKRIELLLQRIQGPLTDPDMVRALRSVEVLESIATPEARSVLEALAKGAPAHRLTQAAEDALKRLQLRGS
jgi:WD40 repeat protein